jgi:hypothetical protein
MYAKCGDIDCSCAVFDGNLDRNGLLGASWLLAMYGTIVLKKG